ncbi:hypothetical protein B0H66DRAFT_599103 [Apodospora peruviana]|uniref:Uncharacterized protein n=1 Tax=Apodospora peruviana TaxID=516989 RepID=A0AAE0IHP6_9PEZI|nr:hypothetical protein B0H66DRAFT_599103 [Apodospora peruviana]
MRPDPDLDKSNVSHKSFINTLEAAWEASADDIDQLLLLNKFASLELEKGGDSDDASDEEDAGQASTSAQPLKQKK